MKGRGPTEAIDPATAVARMRADDEAEAAAFSRARHGPPELEAPPAPLLACLHCVCGRHVQQPDPQARAELARACPDCGSRARGRRFLNACTRPATWRAWLSAVAINEEESRNGVQ